MNLRISNLDKYYNGKKVIDDISFEIKDIHSLVIIGPSGSGKSTLLKILSGLIIPENGYIEINSHKLLFNEKNLREHRKKMGIVFQSYNLFPHLTALENIILPLIKVHKLEKEQAVNRAHNLLKRFGLDKHSHKKPYELSGGQNQRVAISRSMAIKPEILMLDEPTSALDPSLIYEVLDMIKELRQENTDIIFVTHEMSFAKQITEKVMFLHDGKIIELGDAECVFNNPEHEFVKDFLSKILKY
jgi:polar amino acid transport system ATP-binding protein